MTTTRETAQAKARAEGREIVEYADGSWVALPTTQEYERARIGCLCRHPQRLEDYCELCGYRIGGSHQATPREAHEIFVASDGEVHDYE